MDNKNAPVTTFDDVERFARWAPTYDRSIMQRLYFGPVHAKMLMLLVHAEPQPSPERILDVGCGTGRLLRAASVHWPQAELWGVDPADQMLVAAARSNPKAVFRQAFAEALPFPDQSVDLAMSSLSFHHWANHARGLNEIARVLRPGGYMCLADHSMVLAKRWGEKVKSGAEIRTLMKNAGLTVRCQAGMGIRFVLITLAQK